MNKKKRFKKVVIYKDYNWQKGNVDLSHLIFLIVGLLGGGIFNAKILNNFLIAIICISLLILIALVLYIIRKGKRKVFWEEQ